MPTKYTPKPGVKRRVPPNPEDVAAAVAAVKDGASLKGTARRYEINIMTLKRLIRRGEERVPGYQKSLVFIEEEEQQLAEYLLQASKLNYGLPLKKFKELAYEFAKANDKKIPSSWEVKKIAGRDWALGFMQRHSNLSLRSPEPTSLARSTAFNRHTVSAFFEKLRNILVKHRFTPEKIWNLDETGVTTVHKPSKIIGQKGVKQVAKVTSGERGQLMTVCSAINACGGHIPLFLIFPRVNWQDRMLQGAPPGSGGAPHPSGWMTRENFLKYLEHFQKHTNCSQDNRHLIILDNHDSHVNIDVINFARANGVVLLTLPPHTSHKLQPLDRSVFGPLKTFYNAAASDWMTNHPGKNITVYDIPGLLGQAYPKAFSPANILSGFRVSGIFPFNSDIFRDDEFFTSLVTDRPNPMEESRNDEPSSTPPTSPQPGPSGQSRTSTSVIKSPAANPAEESPNDEPLTPPPTFPSLMLSGQSKTPTSKIAKSPVVFVSPMEVRPFPKAPPRVQNATKGRKRGRCRVLTDTPEKNELEAERDNRAARASGVRKNFTKKAPKKKKEEEKKMCDSSDEEDFWDESGDSLDDVNPYGSSDDSEVEEDDFCETCSPCVGDYVFVAFAGKKSRTFYVGRVTEEDPPTSELLINFLRKESAHFHFPSIKDEVLVPRDWVKKVLPLPSIRRGHYTFKIKFPNVNIC